MSGWIKLHRKIQEHWLFSFNEPDKALAFIDLVLSASFDDGTVMIKGRTYTVKRGQFLVAQTTLQKRWKWSQNKVKRFLNLLKNERMVDVETDERTSIITICNYLDYQSVERAGERADERPSERTVERATKEQSNDIKRSKELQEGKEVKKNNSKQLDFSEWPCMASSEVFNDWVSLRKSKKATISQTVINQIGKELTKAVNQGWTVDGALSEAIAAGWQGFKADWLITRSAGGKQAASNINQIANAAKEYLNERQ